MFSKQIRQAAEKRLTAIHRTLLPAVVETVRTSSLKRGQGLAPGAFTQANSPQVWPDVIIAFPQRIKDLPAHGVESPIRSGQRISGLSGN